MGGKKNKVNTKKKVAPPVIEPFSKELKNLENVSETNEIKQESEEFFQQLFSGDVLPVTPESDKKTFVTDKNDAHMKNKRNPSAKEKKNITITEKNNRSFDNPLEECLKSQQLKSYPLESSVTNPERLDLSQSLPKASMQSLREVRGETVYERVGGFVTETIEWRAERPEVGVLVLPGNPGCAFYYTDFASELFCQLEGRASVTVLSHLGHNLMTTQDRARWADTFSLEDQISHQKRLITHRAASGTHPPLVVVGHSIGVHMALRLLEDQPKEVDGVIGLFPFLEVDNKSPRQNIIRFLVRQRLFISAVEYVASWIAVLPASVQSMILKAQVSSHFSPSALETARKCMTQPSVIRNAAFMAHTEFEDLDCVPKWGFFKTVSSKVKMVFTQNDAWGPLTMKDKMKGLVPDLQCDECDITENVDHAFCTNVFQSISVASRTVGLLKNLVKL